uniref:Uncharacterized protein n=1 Tax=uncultured Candidatus Melainabacteria bacterium TaxID=2682970 RepID=A0A650EJ34_9BACT|nr:hypothetical protein Melaina855_0860 [uncultured Candidatus Melainabacteria bacterium]
MEQITLNNEQLSKLMNENRINLNCDGNSTIDIYDGNVSYNNNGEIYNLKSADFLFEKQKIDNLETIQYFQFLVCEYLNLSSREVIFYQKSAEEIVFKVRLIARKEVLIVLSDKRNAIVNCKNFFEDKDFITENQIGIYRRLGESNYYFRWVEEE